MSSNLTSATNYGNMVELGRHACLKSKWLKGRLGSNPSVATKLNDKCSRGEIPCRLRKVLPVDYEKEIGYGLVFIGASVNWVNQQTPNL